MNFVIDLAVWTGVIQAFLMPFMLVGGGIWVFFGFRPEKVKRAERRKESPKPKEKLKPLNCTKCAAALAFDGNLLRCTHCDSTQPVPESYAEIFEHRSQGLKDIHEASAYLNKARILTSNWLKAVIIILGLWLFLSPIFLLIAASNDHRHDALIKWFGNWIILVGASQVLWVIICFMTAASITKVKLTVPKLSDPKEAVRPEFAGCGSCGGGIQFAAGDLATLCGFCGVETFRSQISWSVAKKAKGQAQVAKESLAKAQQACERAVDDVIGSPSIVVFIFVYLPLMLILPAMAWDWIKGHVLLSIVGLVVIIGVINLVVWLRKKLSPRDNLPK